MILTGEEIEEGVAAGTIVIEPFEPSRIEPNSYGFRLGDELAWCDALSLDCHKPEALTRMRLDERGLCLEPGRLYLGHTFERMGSSMHAATLYASRSTSTLGVWIQMSAPLGHTGAILHWTLEIAVAHRVILYPRQPIGKIAFWQSQGVVASYAGRYIGSESAVASRLFQDFESGSADRIDCRKTAHIVRRRIAHGNRH